MSATLEDLASRLQRLEHDFQELAHVPKRPAIQEPGDLADRISFRAWMKLSAPTFAVLAAGFTLVWNAQQATSAQMLEMSRTLGRLDATTERTNDHLDRLGQRFDAFDDRLGSFDRRLASFDQRLDQFDRRLDQFGQRLDQFDQRLDQFGQRLDQFGQSVDRLAVAVERLEAKL